MKKHYQKRYAFCHPKHTLSKRVARCQQRIIKTVIKRFHTIIKLFQYPKTINHNHPNQFINEQVAKTYNSESSLSSADADVGFLEDPLAATQDRARISARRHLSASSLRSLPMFQQVMSFRGDSMNVFPTAAHRRAGTLNVRGGQEPTDSYATRVFALRL